MLVGTKVFVVYSGQHSCELAKTHMVYFLCGFQISHMFVPKLVYISILNKNIC